MNEIIVDKNLVIDSNIGETDYVLHDVRKDPFDVYGLYDYRTEPVFKRMPDSIGKNTNPGVERLYLNTAGGRVRFSTDSPYIAIKALMSRIDRKSHMPLLCSAGFDLYEDFPEAELSRFLNSFKPDVNIKDTLESKINVGTTGKMRHFTINFPTYSDVSALYVALKDGSNIGHGMKYRNKKPVVF